MEGGPSCFRITNSQKTMNKRNQRIGVVGKEKLACKNLPESSQVIAKACYVI